MHNTRKCTEAQGRLAIGPWSRWRKLRRRRPGAWWFPGSFRSMDQRVSGNRPGIVGRVTESGRTRYIIPRFDGPDPYPLSGLRANNRPWTEICERDLSVGQRWTSRMGLPYGSRLGSPGA